MKALKGAASSTLSSLVRTVSALTHALRHRSGKEVVSLVMEGSPLEDLVNGVSQMAFWVLALSPILIVPVYYLLVSLK